MTNFEEWVGKMNTYFGEDYLKGNCDVEWLFDGKVTICYDITNNKVGIAKCHPDDENDFHIGKAIAYARCKGYKIPKQKVYKKLSEMKNGERFKWSNKKYIFIGENQLDDVTYITINIHKYTHYEPNYYQTFYGDNNKYEMVD